MSRQFRRCEDVEGVSYLTADLRLVCYTENWFVFAGYAGVMLILYTVGLPAAIIAVLWGRRFKYAHTLRYCRVVVEFWGVHYCHTL